jgi:Ni,Fe-hydrogenase III small subunit
MKITINDSRIKIVTTIISHRITDPFSSLPNNVVVVVTGDGTVAGGGVSNTLRACAGVVSIPSMSYQDMISVLFFSIN